MMDMQELDFTEAPWDESESFILRKYPAYESIGTPSSITEL